jgi:hypothetical protein
MSSSARPSGRDELEGQAGRGRDSPARRGHRGVQPRPGAVAATGGRRSAEDRRRTRRAPRGVPGAVRASSSRLGSRPLRAACVSVRRPVAPGESVAGRGRGVVTDPEAQPRSGALEGFDIHVAGRPTAVSPTMRASMTTLRSGPWPSRLRSRSATTDNSTWAANGAQSSSSATTSVSAWVLPAARAASASPRSRTNSSALARMKSSTCSSSIGVRTATGRPRWVRIPSLPPATGHPGDGPGS